MSELDSDLDGRDREWLLQEVKTLRAAIRVHRDSSGQALCWHHPQLWNLLPDATAASIAIPPWPQFLRGCVRYRQSLDEQLPGAPADARESDAGSD